MPATELASCSNFTTERAVQKSTLTLELAPHILMRPAMSALEALRHLPSLILSVMLVLIPTPYSVSLPHLTFSVSKRTATSASGRRGPISNLKLLKISGCLILPTPLNMELYTKVQALSFIILIMEITGQ